MPKFLIKMALIGIAAALCGGFGLYLCNTLHSPSETVNAFAILLFLGICGTLPVLLTLVWNVIRRMIYEVFYSAAKGLKDAKKNRKK
jgi:hypothetical protein